MKRGKLRSVIRADGDVVEQLTGTDLHMDPLPAKPHGNIASIKHVATTR
jgi:hypothetical protein